MAWLLCAKCHLAMSWPTDMATARSTTTTGATEATPKCSRSRNAQRRVKFLTVRINITPEISVADITFNGAQEDTQKTGCQTPYLTANPVGIFFLLPQDCLTVASQSIITMPRGRAVWQLAWLDSTRCSDPIRVASDIAWAVRPETVG